jgi:hypothetical protein
MSVVEPRSTYRGRGEIGVVYLPSQLVLSYLTLYVMLVI